MTLPLYRPNRPARSGRRRIAMAAIATLLLGACSGSSSGSSSSRSSPSSTSPSAATPTTASWPATAPCRSGASEDHDLVVPSKVYGGTDRVTVHLTPCVAQAGRPVPVLYLLHGAGNDEGQWRDVGVLAAADRAVADGTFPPSVIVIPNAQGAYSCSDCQANLTTHLLQEIEPKLSAFANIDTSHRAIGGISVGGGRALTVAAHHPNDFVAVGGHSPIPVKSAELDLLAGRMPVYLDVGRDDSFASSTEKMARELEDHGATVELALNAGGHRDPYWHDHLTEYLEFYGRHLG